MRVTSAEPSDNVKCLVNDVASMLQLAMLHFLYLLHLMVVVCYI